MAALWWKFVTYLPPIRGRVLPKKLTTNMLIANIVIWLLWMGGGFNNTAFTTMQAMDGKLQLRILSQPRPRGGANMAFRSNT